VFQLHQDAFAKRKRGGERPGNCEEEREGSDDEEGTE
jgi:hypothetical protein